MRPTESTYAEILADLDKIIRHERNYYNGVIFKSALEVFSKRQTTRDGAKTLAIVASPCANNDYLSIFTVRGRSLYAERRKIVEEMFAKAGVRSADLNYRPGFSLTSKPGHTCAGSNDTDEKEVEEKGTELNYPKQDISDVEMRDLIESLQSTEVSDLELLLNSSFDEDFDDTEDKRPKLMLELLTKIEKVFLKKNFNNIKKIINAIGNNKNW